MNTKFILIKMSVVLVIAVSACSQAKSLEPTRTIAHNEIYDVTISHPTATETSANPSTDVPTAVLPTATKAELPIFLNFDIAENVPSHDVDIIRRGMEIAQSFLEDSLGGGIPVEVQRTITVKIVATGEGCCTALDEHGARLFFDVADPDWISNTRNWNQPPIKWSGDVNGQKIGAHEYIHGWWNTLGCMTMGYQPLPWWLGEGAAEYIATVAVLPSDISNTSETDIDWFMLNSSKGTGELKYPLKYYENGTNIWPGHIGYLAVEYLVAHSPSGILSLRHVCEYIAQGHGASKSFEMAFGISLEDFYQEFPGYISTITQELQAIIVIPFEAWEIDESACRPTVAATPTALSLRCLGRITRTGGPPNPEFAFYAFGFNPSEYQPSEWNVQSNCEVAGAGGYGEFITIEIIPPSIGKMCTITFDFPNGVMAETTVFVEN